MPPPKTPIKKPGKPGKGDRPPGRPPAPGGPVNPPDPSEKRRPELVRLFHPGVLMYTNPYAGVIGLALILLVLAGFQKAWRDHRHPLCYHDDTVPCRITGPTGICHDPCCPGYGEIGQCVPHRTRRKP
jgi:hypothetical protein